MLFFIVITKFFFLVSCKLINKLVFFIFEIILIIAIRFCQTQKFLFLRFLNNLSSFKNDLFFLIFSFKIIK